MLPIDDILTDLIFIMLHLALFLLNYRIMRKQVFHPAILFSFVWFAILLLHFVTKLTLLNELFPLGIHTYYLFFIGVLFFSMGSFMVTMHSQRVNSFSDTINKGLVHDDNEDISLILRTIFIAIIAVGLPLYIMVAFKFFLASQIDDFFIGLRTEINYGDNDFGPLKYLLTFSLVVFGINLHAFLKNRNNLNLFILIASLVISLGYVVFATGRTFYLIILLMFLCISYLHNKNFSLKKYIWIPIVFLVGFSLLGIVYKKGGDIENTAKENLTQSLETTATYFVASLSALDYETKLNIEKSNDGDNTLRFFVLIGQKLKLFPNKKAKELIQPFVFVPYSTNVYTYYSPYLRDFGKLYAWIMLALFGAIHTWLYNKAVYKKRLRETLYYSFSLYPLVMSFFMDFYFTIISTWIQIIVFTELIIIINGFLNKIVKPKTDIGVDISRTVI